MISRFADSAQLASHAPWLWNAIFGTPALRRLANRMVGFHPQRTIPLMPRLTVAKWFARQQPPQLPADAPQVFLFLDEFTNYNDLAAGIATIELLQGLGYRVVIPNHRESGRASLSKGLLRRARSFAEHNVKALAPLVTAETPLLGIEPSAILCFRDEYPDLLRDEAQQQARQLAANTFMIDEFIIREVDAGRITSDAFTPANNIIHLHGHCQQKAIASLTPTVRMLKLPTGNQVRLIPSGCCGMAGSFGYEAEHFDLSNRIGELVLFPRVRDAAPDHIIAAPGTSCRHQIHDATGRTALHPAQILRPYLKA
jgi:Fe-S oxidoreductase